MAKQVVIADVLYGARPTKKNPQVMRLSVGDAQFLDIALPLYNRVMAGEIDAVEYDDATKPLEIENADGTKTNVQFHSVIGVKKNIRVILAQKTAEAEAINAFDQAAYLAAQKKAEGLVL